MWGSLLISGGYDGAERRRSSDLWWRMRLEHMMHLHADLKPPVDVGPGPFGTRQIFDVTGGRFEGPGLNGSVVASGADWILVGGDGVGRLDVRATLRTDDGALVYVKYPGVLVFNEAVMTALGPRAVRFSRRYRILHPAPLRDGRPQLRMAQLRRRGPAKGASSPTPSSTNISRVLNDA